MSIVTTPPAIHPLRATSLAEVIVKLDNVIDWSVANKSRMGYFAVLYKLMTEAVLAGISKNVFDDGKRMERLDVIFANRYLDAWYAYTRKKPCTNAWCATFDACSSNQLIVLQHLILGINTHINLDLGIAAAETSPGDDIVHLEKDFNKINDIIIDLSEQIQEALCRVWFPLRFINKLTRNREDAVINFSIKTARQTSWANAMALAQVTGNAKTNYINLIDNSVVAIAKRVINPGIYTSLLLRPVRAMESKDIAHNIRLLQKEHQQAV